jgi:hypothetical protein
MAAIAVAPVVRTYMEVAPHDVLAASRYSATAGCIGGGRNHHHVAGFAKPRVARNRITVSWTPNHIGRCGISSPISACSMAMRAVMSAFSNAAQ